MTDFHQFGLADPILRAVAAEGYRHPTPIQSAAIPAILSGRDVLGTAETGSGKTASFVLPVLHRLDAARRAPPPRGCRVLMLAPTRELAAQIADTVTALGRHLRPTTSVIVGGVKPGPQIRALARGVDIVVATPGRLLDHLGTGAVTLRHTTAVVIDEADRMLDLGFLPAIRRIVAQVPATRQTVLLSATMPPPVRALAAAFLKDPTEIALAPEARPVSRIDQRVILVPGPAKRQLLVDLLDDHGVARAIVFTRTKRGADRVNGHLQKAGLSAAAIHGDKSQNARDRALAAFRSGGVRILVATDVAARGIDVEAVSHVVNYELPNVPEAYVHRVGRTARAGAGGIAISLCDDSERGYLRDIERLIGAQLRRASAGAAPVPSRSPMPPSPSPSQQQRRRETAAAEEPADAGLARMLGRSGSGRGRAPRRRAAAIAG